MNVAEMVGAARASVRHLSVDELAAELDGTGAVLVDVREPGEWATGVIPGAVLAPRGMLEFHADAATPYHLPELQPDRRTILYCKSGARSTLAAATLASMGYTDVADLDGGIAAWVDAQRPIEVPA